MTKAKGKIIISSLLLFSCIVSGVILAASPSPKIVRLNYKTELDSLLQLRFYQAGIKDEQISLYSIDVDTIFSRKVYRIEVPRGFSKTSFHFNLHKELFQYDMRVPGRIHFPERNMDLYIYGYDSILRTIRLITKQETDSLQSN